MCNQYDTTGCKTEIKVSFAKKETLWKAKIIARQKINKFPQISLLLAFTKTNEFRNAIVFQ